MNSRNPGANPGATLVGGLLLGLALLGSACDSSCGDVECHFTPAEWAAVQTLSPLPDPQSDPTNRYERDPRAVELGRKLFFETRYSNGLKIASTLGAVGEKGKVSCAACHDPEGAFSDTRSMPNNVSLAVSWTTRNTPSLVNSVYYHNHGWDLRQDTLWNQGSTTPETGTNSAGDRCEYARMLWTHYRSEYNALFPATPLPEALDPKHPQTARFPAKCRPSSDPAVPGPWEMMDKVDSEAISRVMANQGKAVAAYEAKLISRNAPFDRYVAGDRTAISDAAKAGLKLFLGKAACVDCHSGPFFTDQSAHNLGIPQRGPNLPTADDGFFAGVPMLMKNEFRSWGVFSDNPELGKARFASLKQEESQKGKFRTQTLRNVAQSAPYMHTGMLTTVRAVIEHYNKGGDETTGPMKPYSGVKDARMRPLHLTEFEIDNLVAFLETLTGEAVPAALRANPFE